jgi:alcohol dehydrogenase class IV
MLVNAKLLPYMYNNGNNELKSTIDELGIILRTDNIKEYLNNLLIKLDLYKDIPINYDDIDELVDNVNLDRLKNNPYKLSKEDIRNIYIEIFNEIKGRSK